MADGGQSIASAPAVVYGQQLFGNSANGLFTGPDSTEPELHQYWTLSVTAGDTITIDWESQEAYHGLFYFRLYPLGTTDFNVEDTDPLNALTLNDNHRNQLVFTASQSGVMPLEFASFDPGSPYDFTAYVSHAVRLSLPRISTRLGRKATLRVSARNAEGGVISDPALQVDVQIKRGRKWLGAGSASVTDSVAAVKLNIPKRYAGKKISLRAYAHGSGYVSAASRTLRVRVLGRPRTQARTSL